MLAKIGQLVRCSYVFLEHIFGSGKNLSLLLWESTDNSSSQSCDRTPEIGPCRMSAGNLVVGQCFLDAFLDKLHGFAELHQRVFRGRSICVAACNSSWI